jgi:NAD(P)-dependent dehydrogenase (short-subunit alcohol dehydrogenase family)
VPQPGWAVVTGAAGGIGLATCRRLARQGFAVLMLDQQEALLAAAFAQLRAEGGDGEAIAGDVLAPGAAEQAAAAVEARGGRIDALVNVAGGSGPTPVRSIEEMTDASWEGVMALNVTSAFRFCRAIVPGMRARGYGRIVNLSSTAAHGRKGPVTTQGARLAYAAAKAALVGFTAQLAKDEARHGITVNAVMPGLVLGPQGTRIRSRFDSLPEELRRDMVRDIPAGRPGETDEVAAVIAFLCSEASSYVSGVGLPIDGAFL